MSKVFQGVYEGMDFPPYKYEHYPLVMSNPDSKETRTVEGEAEEKAAAEEGFKAPERVGPPVSMSEKELADLHAQIAALQAENSGLKAAKPAPAGAAAKPAA